MTRITGWPSSTGQRILSSPIAVTEGETCWRHSRAIDADYALPVDDVYAAADDVGCIQRHGPVNSEAASAKFNHARHPAAS